MADETYMSDPRAKTVEGFIAGLTILAKYMEKGLQQSYFCGGEHDVINIYVGDDILLADSDDGRELDRLGFGTADGGWYYLT